jgi:hypothetical protein
MVDASEEPTQALAGDEDQIITCASRKVARKPQHRRRVWSVTDRDERAANDACTPPLEQPREHLKLASLGNRNGTTGERLYVHGPTILAETVTRRVVEALAREDQLV